MHLWVMLPNKGMSGGGTRLQWPCTSIASVNGNPGREVIGSEAKADPAPFILGVNCETRGAECAVVFTPASLRPEHPGLPAIGH